MTKQYTSKKDQKKVRSVLQNRTAAAGVPEGFLGLDIGPKSIAMNDEAIKKSKTIVWNGPMGVFDAWPPGAGRLVWFSLVRFLFFLGKASCFFRF